MDSIFKMIDRLLTSIPDNVQRMIRMSALALWVVSAIVVGYWAYSQGKASVPQTGDDLYLSNIKEKVYRDRMKQNPADVTLPDLHELTQQETAPLSVYQPNEKPPESIKKQPEMEPLPLKGEDDTILYPESKPNRTRERDDSLDKKNPSEKKAAPLPLLD